MNNATQTKERTMSSKKENYKTFTYNEETFYWFEKSHTVMDTDGCTITEFKSIDDFIFAANDTDGADMLSGWEY
jgi:hypothetical protein